MYGRTLFGTLQGGNRSHNYLSVHSVLRPVGRREVVCVLTGSYPGDVNQEIIVHTSTQT